MIDSSFFMSDFYNQAVKCQELISNLNRENFDDIFNEFQTISNKKNVKTIASTLLNQIKIKPQSADLIIDFIEKNDQYVKENYSNIDKDYSILMPVFVSIVNPMPLNEQAFLPDVKPELDAFQDIVRFSAIPVSECFIYENLRQRGHIKFDLQEYQNYIRTKDSTLYCSYEVHKDFSFIKTIQFIHLMPNTDFIDFNLKFVKEHFSDFDSPDAFKELSSNYFEIHKRNLLSGFNPSPLATCLREDDLEGLKNIISSKNNFDFTQKIKLSIYDCNVLLKDSNMLEYTAYYGSEKCFTYIFNNSMDKIEELFTKNIARFSVIGGNYELILKINEIFSQLPIIVDENDSSYQSDYFSKCLPYSAAFHHKDITEWLIKIKNFSKESDKFITTGVCSITLNCFYFANWRDMTLFVDDIGYHNCSLYLLAAAMFNNNEMFRNIIEIPNIDLNISYFLMTPINFLVRFDNYEMISLLLEKAKKNGINLDLNKNGFSYISPIMYCCFQQYYKSFSVLIKSEDVDVNQSYRYSEDSEELDAKFNLMTICLKLRLFKMARMVLNHPKFELHKTTDILEKQPYNSNIFLSLNYLLDEKRRMKKRNTKKIDVSGFGD